MNIFILDTEPRVAAKYHCDIHLRAMIRESAQMLSTAHRILDNSNKPIYKTTHINHPCSKWVRSSISNYEWLYSLYFFMHEEYVKRFNKSHRSYSELYQYLQEPPEHIEDTGITKFAQAMPVQYKQADVVKAYRDYYCFEKLRFAKWTSPGYRPYWVTDFLMEHRHD